MGSLCRCVRGSGKCGLDSLFAMNQAHGHLPTQAEKVPKSAILGGRLLDALWDGILGHFWQHVGSILGPFWAQNCQNRRSQNRLDKKVQKKSCRCLQVFVAVGAAVPLRSSNRTARGTFEHPTVTPLGALWARWRIPYVATQG